MGNTTPPSESSAPSPVTIITTHLNADFDAIASMLAAQKLYPDSILVFPGAHEKTFKNFFISSLVYLFTMIDINEIDSLNIERVVLVDANRKERLGKIATLLDSDNIDIHIYDHHPIEKNSIRGSYEVIRTTGATITLLTELLKEKQIDISPEEATVMCLGLYEDTGSFTYTTTTEADFHAAAWLLSQGASLDIIANMISKELNQQQIACLNDMLQSATRIRINGTEIITTTISTENYIKDLAVAVQKMMQVEKAPAIFVVARMGNRINIIARSRVAEVDCGEIIKKMGGGGHAQAASATLKDQTLSQAEQALNKALYETVKSDKLAKDIMSSPPISVPPDTPCEEVADLMTRYNINAVLIMDTGNTVDAIRGYITRQVIEKSLYHKLGPASVSEYMNPEFISVEIDTELDEIQEVIIENKQKILPVIHNNIIQGVVTRTDLLNLLVQQSQMNTGKFPDPLKKPFYARTKNIRKFMTERLPGPILDLLKNIGDVASREGFGVYVVGGFVRDLLLYRNNDDIDIVIEGDGIRFAKTYAAIEGARINTYEKFGTAVIVLPDGFKIDVATARMEYYTEPAALPEIEMSSIKMDLYRRDFTINTLAIRLDPGHFGTLIDFFSGQRDLKDKAIRIIHNLSFVEDPTRVFRAIKFEKRYDFTIGQLTSGLIENAVKMDFFKRLGGSRVFSELKQILEEEDPIPAILRLFDYRLMKNIHPDIRMTDRLLANLRSVKKIIIWHNLLYQEEKCDKWVLYFLAFIEKLPPNAGALIAESFNLPPRYKKTFTTERYKIHSHKIWLERKLPVKNSVLYTKLSGLKTELILYLMATTESEAARKAISFYFSDLKSVQTHIKGRDIKALGVNPGPQYKKLLKRVLDARLDGLVVSKSDEIEYLKQII